MIASTIRSEFFKSSREVVPFRRARISLLAAPVIVPFSTSRFRFFSMPFSPLSTSSALTSRTRSEEHTSELQSRLHLVCRLLLEKKKDLYKLYKDRQKLHDFIHASSEMSHCYPLFALEVASLVASSVVRPLCHVMRTASAGD